jgi:hypothetical protein
MKNTIRSLALVATSVALVTGSAVAGSQSSPYIYIDKSPDGSGFVQGSTTAAHNSSDTSQYLGCWVSVRWPGVPPTMGCSATDAGGERLLCYSSDPGLVAMAEAADADSWIQFFVDAKGGCTGLTVERSSETPAKSH